MTYQPWSWLKIDGRKVFDHHARDIKSQYKWISEGGDIVRLANGQRRSLRRQQFRKMALTISGQASRKPAIDHLHRGDVVVIDCPFHIDMPGDVADGDLIRNAVEGSIYRFGEADGPGQMKQTVILNHGDSGVLMTSFRPRLTIMLDEIDVSEDEQSATCTWSISGEEV